MLTLNVRPSARDAEASPARNTRSVGVQGYPRMAMTRSAGGPLAHYVGREAHVIVPTQFPEQWAVEQAAMEARRFVKPNPIIFEDEPFYEDGSTLPQWRLRQNNSAAWNGTRPHEFAWDGSRTRPTPPGEGLPQILPLECPSDVHKSDSEEITQRGSRDVEMEAGESAMDPDRVEETHEGRRLVDPIAVPTGRPAAFEHPLLALQMSRNPWCHPSQDALT